MVDKIKSLRIYRPVLHGTFIPGLCPTLKDARSSAIAWFSRMHTHVHADTGIQVEISYKPEKFQHQVRYQQGTNEVSNSSWGGCVARKTSSRRMHMWCHLQDGLARHWEEAPE